MILSIFSFLSFSRNSSKISCCLYPSPLSLFVCLSLYIYIYFIVSIYLSLSLSLYLSYSLLFLFWLNPRVHLHDPEMWSIYQIVHYWIKPNHFFFTTVSKCKDIFRQMCLVSNISYVMLVFCLRWASTEVVNADWTLS